MLVIQWTPFENIVEKRKWFWHRWVIPVKFAGVALIPRGYLEGASVKVVSANGLRILGIEMSFVTTIPREIELEALNHD